MFDMKSIGENISEMRKASGLTQMDMAEKLGISFQAVSNWERGVSMPDISKLSALSRLFNVTIDEILNNTADNSDIVRTSDEHQSTASPDFATNNEDPILKEQFSDTETSNDYAAESADNDVTSDEVINQEYINSLQRIAVFVDKSVVDKGVEKIIKHQEYAEQAASLLCFMSRSTADKLADVLIEKSVDFSVFQRLLCFISKEKVDAYAKKISDLDIGAIKQMAPFMNKAALTDIAKKMLAEGQVEELSHIICFTDYNLS